MDAKDKIRLKRGKSMKDGDKEVKGAKNENLGATFNFKLLD